MTTPVPLLEPRDGLPSVVDSPAQLARVAAAFAAGTGPVAVDAERASGYRYGQRAYLVQLRRAGAGTALIDPIGCPDLGTLGEAIADAEWVLHAASQDLACLAEVGLHPQRIFDTELGGRLAGLDRVGLGPMVEELLGLTLEKGHSAADWSRRPLPESWLRYAALDVEVLVELRDTLEEDLRRQGKLDWALEEYAAVLAAAPPSPRVEPWRRTSGIHRVKGRRQLAAVRALWEERDRVARERDVAPGRILTDAAIVTAALANPKTEAELLRLATFGGRSTKRLAPAFFGALASASDLAEAQLPLMTPPTGDGPPPSSRWAERDPRAAARLARARAGLGEVATLYRLPLENLLAPDSVRRLAWTPPNPLSRETVAVALRGMGTRAWQIELTAGPLANALVEPPEAAEPEALSPKRLSPKP